MKKINYRELLVYIVGTIILSFGLCFNTKLSLGTSALMALPVAISNIYKLELGTVTFIYQASFIVIEVIIHIIMKKYKSIIGDILQIITNLVFSVLLNIFNGILPDFSLLDNVFGSVFVRILLLLVSIIIVGVGAALTLKTKYPPNPPDGIVKTGAEFTKKDMGLVKNFIDIFFVIVTVIFSYMVSKKIIGIGIGTIIAMLGVGRVIYYFNKSFGKKVDNFIK